MRRIESGYSPLPTNMQEAINKTWEFYKNNIGLEGQIVLDLRQSGKTKAEIDEIISNHRADRELLMPFYKEVKEKNIT